jgi:leader peptidase (prepilin peptidase) / N-methyltransferase
LTRVRPAATHAGELHPSIGGRGFGQRCGETLDVSRLRLAAVLVWIALAACCVAVFGLTVEALVDAAGCAVIVAVTVTDLERRIVPNRIVVPALAVALVVQTARDPSVEWLVAAAAAGGFFLLLALVYPAGLGMGDVKLAAFMGAWLGRDVAVALFVGSLAGAVAAVVVLALQGSSGRKVTLPYVPALAVGAVVGLFFGAALLDAWL